MSTLVSVNRNKIYTVRDYDLEDYDPNSFLYIIKTTEANFPWSWAMWCKDNCKSIWGWWFNDGVCYIGFNNEEEAIWFCTVYL